MNKQSSLECVLLKYNNTNYIVPGRALKEVLPSKLSTITSDLNGNKIIKWQGEEFLLQLLDNAVRNDEYKSYKQLIMRDVEGNLFATIVENIPQKVLIQEDELSWEDEKNKIVAVGTHVSTQILAKIPSLYVMEL